MNSNSKFITVFSARKEMHYSEDTREPGQLLYKENQLKYSSTRQKAGGSNKLPDKRTIIADTQVH